MAFRRTSRDRRSFAEDFKNGQGILYRPVDANERPYSQQWNLTIERELPHGIFGSVAYVGNKGTRLPSNLQPINVLNPNDAKIQGARAEIARKLRSRASG